MSVQDDATIGSKGRKRGGTLRISRDLILGAAKNVDPQNLTMQAVADELGVDRKALNYHVTDREGLMRLVAADVFATNFSEAFERHFDAADAAKPDAWKQAMYAWASAVRDGMVAAGTLVNYFVIDTDDLSVFEPAELVLRVVRVAGFDSVTAGRALIFMTHFGMGVGRDIVLQKQLGSHPQGAEVHRVLDAVDEGAKFEELQSLISADLNSVTDIQAQFDFEVEMLVRGMEQSLSK